jgi:hypothetical protein
LKERPGDQGDDAAAEAERRGERRPKQRARSEQQDREPGHERLAREALPAPDEEEGDRRDAMAGGHERDQEGSDQSQGHLPGEPARVHQRTERRPRVQPAESQRHCGGQHLHDRVVRQRAQDETEPDDDQDRRAHARGLHRGSIGAVIPELRAGSTFLENRGIEDE